MPLDPVRYPVLFAFHSGRGALAVLLDEKNYGLVSTTTLRELGWHCDDLELARALPRLDTPQLHLPPRNRTR
jgi:hypothetical protein